MTELLNPTQPERNEQDLQLELILSHNPNSDVWHQAEVLEAAVFEGEQYIASPSELQKEYEPYLNHTRMIAVNQGDRTIGAMRVISYDRASNLKTLDDIEKGRLAIDEQGQEVLASIPKDKIVEVGTIALDKSYRTSPEQDSHTISSLYGSIYALCLKENTPHIIASFDEEYAQRFKKLFGPAVIELGPPTDYMGSPTVPVIMDTDELKKYFSSIGADSYVAGLVELGNSIRHER